MGDASDDTPRIIIGTVSPFLAVPLAVAQAGLIWALARLWASGSSDATATVVDWGFLGLAMATPATLALSGWSGWKLSTRIHPKGPLVIRGAARAMQWVTLLLTALALLFAPIALFGEVFFGPMG